MLINDKKLNIKNFFGRKIRHARVQRVCSRRSTARRRASLGHIGLAETKPTLEIETADSEDNGQDQGDETPANASRSLPITDTRVYKVSSIPSLGSEFSDTLMPSVTPEIHER